MAKEQRFEYKIARPGTFGINSPQFTCFGRRDVSLLLKISVLADPGSDPKEKRI
jgi:hypothetical protein